MKDNYTLTVLGCGVMGTAVLSAVLKSDITPFPGKVYACVNSEASAARLTKSLQDSRVQVVFGVKDKQAAVKEADVVVLGCKPFMYKDVHQQVESALSHQPLVISLLAGTTLGELSIFSPKVVKVMTNTPAKFGCGTATVAFPPNIEIEKNFVLELVGTVGVAMEIPEKNMDAATALVGSGPAFCLLMMESLIDGGVRMGLPFEVARVCAAKVMEGTAKMALDTGDHPAVLKSKVCTPGGTTIGGLLKMEDSGVRSGIARGVEEAALISASFAKK